MSDNLLPTNGQGAESATNAAALPGAKVSDRKALDLAVIKKGTKDYLDFLDSTKETFFAYLYHRTGSMELAKTLMSEIYLDTLSRAMSFWWFGGLSFRALLDSAERALAQKDLGNADVDSVYLPTLNWLAGDEKKAVGELHESLWTLPHAAQQLLILSLLVGLSDEKMANVLRLPIDTLKDQLRTAKEMLFTRWQSGSSLGQKLESLVFMPSLDLTAETALRMSVVEKYNALRFKRYQWVIIGGLFAVLSNVIVASVLAFAVIIQPPTSLMGTRTQVASLDALLLQRDIAVSDSKLSLAASFKEAQRIAAYDVSRDLTNLGLASALESLQSQQDQEAEVNRLIKLMQRAATAWQEASPLVVAMVHTLFGI